MFSQWTAWSFSNSNKKIHSCMITLCQANTSNTRKQNLDKYIAPSPWLIVINMRNCFVKTFIVRNTDEPCRRYSGLDKFPHPQVSVHHMKYPYILVLFPLKRPIFLLWKSWRLRFKYGMELGIYTRTKDVIYHILGRNYLIYNGYLWKII